MIKEILKDVIKEILTDKPKNEKKDIQQNESLAKKFYGKICMFRTYSAGVHFGELVEKNGQECHVKNAKRVWSWAKACSLSQLAVDGDLDADSENSRISVAVSDIILGQVIEIIPMAENAIKNLYGAKEWKK